MMDAQRDVECFMACHDLRHDAATHLLDLVSEVGELSKLVLEASEYGRLQIEHDADFSGELGDVLYSLLAVAVTLEIDAGDALDGALRKYERRLAEGHGPGST